MLRLVHFVIKEESICSYFASFRESFWPNNQPAPMEPMRSEAEKTKLKELLEEAILLNLSCR
jgi:hypothetical protein